LYKPQKRKKISTALRFVQTAEEKKFSTVLQFLYKPQKRKKISTVLQFVQTAEEKKI